MAAKIFNWMGTHSHLYGALVCSDPLNFFCHLGFFNLSYKNIIVYQHVFVYLQKKNYKQKDYHTIKLTCLLNAPFLKYDLKV